MSLCDDFTIVTVLREPAIIGPTPMHNNGIDYSWDNRAENDVTIEAASLSYGTRDYRCTGGSKSILQNKSEMIQ